MTESDRNDSGAVLVGRLIRTYLDEARRNGRRLTQEGLLDLMVELGDESAASWDRSMISAAAIRIAVAAGKYVTRFNVSHCGRWEEEMVETGEGRTPRPEDS
ncbi:MAG: hypothetical protein J4G14_10015, partial [Dehalococcoidia bacterium]|nr:hypothetical protein [Dehalococcoidia bacterium]